MINHEILQKWEQFEISLAFATNSTILLNEFKSFKLWKTYQTDPLFLTKIVENLPVTKDVIMAEQPTKRTNLKEPKRPAKDTEDGGKTKKSATMPPEDYHVIDRFVLALLNFRI